MPRTTEKGVFTVAALRRRRGAKEIEVLFNESERIYTLPRTKARAALGRHLTSVRKSKSPVKVVLDLRRGVVRRIDEPSPRERRQFERDRTFVEKPEKPVRINVAKLDPTTFNIVGRFLDFRIFRLCARVIPNYATAKQIFDFCAAQSCHLPGPPAVTPCIPFQYVRDGCFARAHKMRKIIVEKYGYCCEKVFSFANEVDDDLWVRADKWGGCCVKWWYHVAPLVRVRIKLFGIKIELAMVIDPSMFDKPVLLSTWLMAQENMSCGANASVAMYSIQPGSAYTPANIQGTSFTTDPNYTATDAKLIQYKNLTTC
ncbi:MAG: protein-glutamine glutaminase family protein [Gemmatimonadaceae bacterium]